MYTILYCVWLVYNTPPRIIVKACLSINIRLILIRRVSLPRITTSYTLCHSFRLKSNCSVGFGWSDLKKTSQKSTKINFMYFAPFPWPRARLRGDRSNVTKISYRLFWLIFFSDHLRRISSKTFKYSYGQPKQFYPHITPK